MVKVAQNSFQRAILNGHILCGGACFYTYSISFLWKFLYQEFIDSFQSANRTRQNFVNKSRIFDLMKSIKRIFMNFARYLLPSTLDEYNIDLTSGHLFQINVSQCDCSLIHKEQLEMSVNLMGEISFREIDFERILNHKIHVRKEAELDMQLMDCFDSKLNCLKLTREVIGSILQVGVFIHDWFELKLRVGLLYRALLRWLSRFSFYYSIGLGGLLHLKFFLHFNPLGTKIFYVKKRILERYS